MEKVKVDKYLIESFSDIGRYKYYIIYNFCNEETTIPSLSECLPIFILVDGGGT